MTASADMTMDSARKCMNGFPARGQVIGSWTMLVDNCRRMKPQWEEFGFDASSVHSRVNMALGLMLCIRSAVECTVDEIAVMAGHLASRLAARKPPAGQWRRLAEFLLHGVLMNDGAMMRFSTYDFEKDKPAEAGIDFVSAKVVDRKTGRTMVSLTENGYMLVLTTMAMEDYLRIPVKDIMIRERLARKEYDSAAEIIMELLHDLRQEKRSNEDAAAAVRRGVKGFSLEKYKIRLERSIETIKKVCADLEQYKAQVDRDIAVFEECGGGGAVELDEKKRENLKNVQESLAKALRLKLEVINSYYVYKEACRQSFRNLHQCVVLHSSRSFAKDVFPKLLEDASLLEGFAEYLHPLFIRGFDKTFSPSQAFKLLENPARGRQIGEAEPEAEPDSEKWRKERRARQEEQDSLSREALLAILSAVRRNGGKATLKEVWALMESGAETAGRQMPSSGVLQDVLLRLVRGRQFNPAAEAEENGDAIRPAGMPELLRSIAESAPEHAGLRLLEVRPIYGGEEMQLEGLDDGAENQETLLCTNLEFSAEYETKGDNDA